MLNQWFDHFITVCILVNSVLLASRNFRGNVIPNFDSEWNDFIDTADTVFTFVYLFECVAKISLMGFAFHENAYIKDPWNKLDFTVVIISLLNFMPGLNPGFLKALRAARVLRPLKSISRLAAMRVLMHTIVASISGLFNVCIFISFVFSIFAILGLNIFNGRQYN